MDLIYRDDYFVAINKPAGLLSIQDGYYKDLDCAKSLLESSFGRVWTVHRLDKDTSGVLVFALNPDAHRELNLQFETRKITKKYLALIHGHPLERNFEIKFPLRVDGDRNHRTVPDSIKGKEACTEIEVLRGIGAGSAIEAHPTTGYTHQIRCHLLAAGFPIVGDKLYKKKDLSVDEFEEFPRLALHASTLRFFHPYLNTILEIFATLPPELNFLQL